MGGSVLPLQGDDEVQMPQETSRKRPAVEAAPEEPAPKQTVLSHASLSRARQLNSAFRLALAPLSETSLSAGVSYEGLDGLELDIIPLNDGIPATLQSTSTLAFDLYNEFIDPDRMVEALQLLSILSSGGSIETSTITTQEGSSPFSVGQRQAANDDVLDRMLNASRHAQRQIENSPKAISILRMRTIMSYITLFLTLEHGVIPKMRAENPDWDNTRINGEKFQYFQRLLAPSSDTKRSLYTFRDHISYGSTFWSFGQELGIASLLMLAVSGFALTTIAKKAGPRSRQIPMMATALLSSQAWWAFAHGVGAHTLHTLFGGESVPSTIPELLSHIRAEPMPACSMLAIHQRCLEKNLQTDVQPISKPALPSSIFIGGLPIPISYHPTGVLDAKLVQKTNVLQWLLKSVDTMTVRDTTKAEVSFGILKSLLPPAEIRIELVELFYGLYNRKAIPGRRVLAASESLLRTLLNQEITFERFLGVSRSASPNNLVLCVFDLSRATVAFLVRRGVPSVQVFNWIEEDEDLKAEIGHIFEVSALPKSPLKVIVSVVR